jgi:lysophospholipase L1-like esterase
MLDKRLIYLRNLPPNAHLTFNSKDIQVSDSFTVEIKDYPCTTDGSGFIVSAVMHKHPDLKFAFLGGSVPQSLYMEEDKRMPEAVSREVENVTGLKINTWNCAAGGTNSYHTLNVLNNLVLQLKPDYAFFYGNINDVATLSHYSSFNNPNLRWGIFFNMREFDKANRPSSHRLLPYITNAIQNGLKLKPIQDDFADVRDSLLVFDTVVLAAAVRQVYKTMIAVCRANNIKPVLITQVNLYNKLSYGWMQKNMPLLSISSAEYRNLILSFEAYNEILRELANTENVMLIDLPVSEFGFADFYDPSHLNSIGYSKTNMQIARQFAEKSKCDKCLLSGAKNIEIE